MMCLPPGAPATTVTGAQVSESLKQISNSRVTLVMGAPRSGTSWLGKIFDSHPDVLYRHEPDIAEPEASLPQYVPLERMAAHRSDMAAYLHRLMGISTLKTAGSLPVFAKSFQPSHARYVRFTVIAVLKALQAMRPRQSQMQSARVPDMLTEGAQLRVVMKSITARGRARLMSESLPGCKTVFIIRDPRGQIASTLRGQALGKFRHPVRPGELLQATQAAQYGLTQKRLDAMPVIEQMAWHWAVLNQEAIHGLQGRADTQILRYKDLCADPIGKARELFAFCGMPWSEQTETFITRSISGGKPDLYYQVYKNPLESMNRWRTQLTGEEQQRIMSVVRRTPMGKFYPESED
jgi:hypothetical protein